jgi:hypothetical protein
LQGDWISISVRVGVAMVKFIERQTGKLLAKTTGKILSKVGSESSQLPSLARRRSDAVPVPRRRTDNSIPNASMIYAGASAVLFMISLYFFLGLGQFFIGAMLIILSGTLFGFAHFYMKYRN